MSNRSAAVLFLCVFAIGCRTDPNRALLERELRLMEDRVFQLEECVREYQAALVVSEQDNIQLRTGSSTSNCSGPSRRTTGSGVSSRPRVLPKSLNAGRASIAPPVQRSRANGDLRPTPASNGPLQPPRVEINGPGFEATPPNGSDEGKPSRSTLPQGDRTELTLPPAGGRIGGNAEGDAVALAATEDDSKVDRIALAKLATGGYDAEPTPGDEGVTLILRPLDRNGKLVRAAAPVAVVVMDPELPGEDARIARWDFSVNEVARSFKQSGLSEGIHLNMRWPDRPPVHSDLMLFVRFTTRDGQHRETHQTIRIEPPELGVATEQRQPASHGPETMKIDPASKPLKDSPTRIVPHELPAADVARRKTTEPRMATKPDYSRPAWSPNR